MVDDARGRRRRMQNKKQNAVWQSEKKGAILRHWKRDMSKKSTARPLIPFLSDIIHNGETVDHNFTFSVFSHSLLLYSFSSLISSFPHDFAQDRDLALNSTFVAVV